MERKCENCIWYIMKWPCQKGHAVGKGMVIADVTVYDDADMCPDFVDKEWAIEKVKQKNFLRQLLLEERWEMRWKEFGRGISPEFEIRERFSNEEIEKRVEEGRFVGKQRNWGDERWYYAKDKKTLLEIAKGRMLEEIEESEGILRDERRKLKVMKERMDELIGMIAEEE